MNNIEVVKKMYQLFAEGDTEKIKAIFDENLKWNMMVGFPNGGQYIGIEAVFENVFGYLSKYWDTWKAISTRYIETEEGVFVIGHYEGTYKKTGKAVKADFASEYKVKDGKITEYNQYTDTALVIDAMKQTI
ncbi:nuclear transport factor 2 family protein [Flavobacterium sp.]|uniref:nuclear transport factor 2 family protein n=1 Tax=Flavobacterium sp. TaxID=239 RepID=UPI0026343B06|nr:nuclear transport factor 2 family protein [Flavobacterium sp.]